MKKRIDPYDIQIAISMALMVISIIGLVYISCGGLL